MIEYKETFVSGVFQNVQDCTKDAPSWGMSLKKAGTMRFRWDETNTNRNDFLSSLCQTSHSIAQVELIHSQIVYAIEESDETKGLKGDGIITQNKKIIPVVTAADCMPIFIWDDKKNVFGALHSGWKGTGIAVKAIEKANEVYGSTPEDFHIVMAPHIHNCCYSITEERASYFRENFGSDCVTKSNGKLMLSLAKANLNSLLKVGVKKENIYISDDCTSCNEKFGSFRRETMCLPPEMPLEERMKHFTVQAAWIKW